MCDKYALCVTDYWTVNCHGKLEMFSDCDCLLLHIAVHLLTTSIIHSVWKLASIIMITSPCVVAYALTLERPTTPPRSS
jgi:hypothetical protein